METCLNSTDHNRIFISSDARRMISRIRKLKEDHPEEVIITHEPENNDGCIVASVPFKWLKISPPRQLNFSEEQRLRNANRLKEYREKKGNINNA